MYHPYKQGYNTLPNLRKITQEEVFERNREESIYIQKEKEEGLKNQKYFFEHNNKEIFYELSKNFILNNYPIKIKSDNYLDIAKEIDEDFIIHRIDGEKDYMCSAHVIFASHWLPENKIGTSFEQIHKPVPMNLKNSKKLVEAMVNSGIFERFVWSIVYENKYNFHPRFENKKFDQENPCVLIKVERQVTVGFPQEQFCLFVLRQYIIKEEDIDKDALVRAIEGMNEVQKEYKGLQQCESLLTYLKKG
jgi:hypothetical protein